MGKANRRAGDERLQRGVKEHRRLIPSEALFFATCKLLIFAFFFITFNNFPMLSKNLLFQNIAVSALLLLTISMAGCGETTTSTPQSSEHPMLRSDRIVAKLRNAGSDIKGPYSEGFIAIEKDGKRTYIDSNGIVLVPPQFEEASDFRRGYAQVTRAGAWGVINKAGKDLFPFHKDWSYIGEEHDGTMVIGDAAGKQGMIDMKGNAIIPCVYDDISIFDWSHGVVQVKQGGKSGLINRQGVVIAAIAYDNIAWFGEGTARAAVRKDGKWGIINSAGVITHPLSMSYDDVSSFSGGLAQVSSGDKHGYIDTTGTEVIPPGLDKAGPFNRWGHATVIREGAVMMIDYSGKPVLTGAYTGIEQVGADMYRVNSNKEPFQIGIINRAGKILWPMKYLDIYPIGDDIFSVSLEDGALNYYANAKGEKIAERH